MLRAVPTPKDTVGDLTFLLLQPLLWKCLRNNTLKKISYTLFNQDYKQVIQNLPCAYRKKGNKILFVDVIAINIILYI